jgi:hypothetical protein
MVNGTPNDESNTFKGYVGMYGIFLMCVFLVLLFLVIICGLIQVWPPTASSTQTTEPKTADQAKDTRTADQIEETQAADQTTETPAPSDQATQNTQDEETKPVENIKFLLWNLPLSKEARLFLVVCLAGALGGLVHSLRSFSWYVGNRKLVRSWLLRLILIPVVGTSIGLLFYLVLRGGLFSSQATVDQTNPFGIAAVSGLVGMFTEQAAIKLKEIATTFFTKAEQGKDSSPEDQKDTKKPPETPNPSEPPRGEMGQ